MKPGRYRVHLEYVTSTNVAVIDDAGVSFSGLVGASYSCIGGDSGGLVCSGPTNITCEAVGINTY